MRSSRLPRLLVTAAVATVVLPVPALLDAAHGASATTIQVPLSQASWFWRAEPSAIGNTGLAPPVAVPDPTVPGGDLAVAGPEAPAAAGSPSGPIAETYLAFDLSEIPVGATISSFKISLPVDSRGVTADPLGAAIVACAIKSSWAGGQSAAPYSGKPTDACDTHSPRLTAGSGGHSYGADIASIAQQWVKPNALNLGVAITDNPANSLTAYQVVFGPGAALAKLTATVTYQASGSGAPGPIVAGGSSATTPAGDGATATTAPGLVSVVPVGPLPTGLPPDVATQTAPVHSVAPVIAAHVGPAGPSAPPAGFWFALILIVLLLGTTTFVLADPDIPLGVIADRGVARALRARRTAPNNRQETS